MGALDDILGTKPVADGRAARGVTTVAPAANAPASPAPTQPTPQAEAKAKAAAPQQPASAQEAQVAQPEHLGYAEMYRRLSPFLPPTAEELERERRREKREKLFASIGDGISALSNLFFTTQYAPNRFDAQSGQAAKVNDRWEKLRAERAANMRAYTDGLIRAQAMDDEAGQRERTWQRQMQIDEANAKRQAEEKERKDAFNEAQRGKYEAATQKDMAQAAYWEAKADAIANGDPLDIALKKARIAKENAIADKNRRQGTSSWVSGSGGSGGKYSLTDPDGQVHHYDNKAMYEQAVAYYYPDGNDDETVRVTRSATGRVKSTSTTRRPKTTAQKAAELHRQADEAAPPKKKQGWASDLRL